MSPFPTIPLAFNLCWSAFSGRYKILVCLFVCFLWQIRVKNKSKCASLVFSQGLQDSERAPARLPFACLSPGSWPCRGLSAQPAVQSHVFLPRSLSSCPDFQTADFTQSVWWPLDQFPVFLLPFLQRQCHLFEIWFGENTFLPWHQIIHP